MLTAKSILDDFRNAGIGPGSILVVQSSYKGVGEVEGGPLGLIHALLEVIGPTGTLIMPAYNFVSWTEGHYFDFMETPSNTGIIGELFRQKEGVRRTKHPIHSLSVQGKHQSELCSIDSIDSFGNDSVFAKLLEYNAFYCSIGLGVKTPFLPCHLPETELRVPYRRQKLFTGIYIHENSPPALKTYGFHVRLPGKDHTPVYKAHVLQFEKGYVKRPENTLIDLLYCDARAYHESMIEIITQRPELFA